LMVGENLPNSCPPVMIAAWHIPRLWWERWRQLGLSLISKYFVICTSLPSNLSACLINCWGRNPTQQRSTPSDSQFAATAISETPSSLKICLGRWTPKSKLRLLPQTAWCSHEWPCQQYWQHHLAGRWVALVFSEFWYTKNQIRLTYMKI
jgi:hypothetical protein